MTNNKQSSVEWYSVKRDVLEIEVRLGKLCANEYAEELAKAEQQAKAMHKEEVERAWRNGDGIFDLTSDIFAEKYYNKMFTNPNDEKL